MFKSNSKRFHPEIALNEFILFQKSDFNDQSFNFKEEAIEKIIEFYCLSTYASVYKRFFEHLTEDSINKIEEAKRDIKNRKELSEDVLKICQTELEDQDQKYNSFLRNLKILSEEMVQGILDKFRFSFLKILCICFVKIVFLGIG